MSVSMLMAHRGESLFQRAVGESGGLSSRPARAKYCSQCEHDGEKYAACRAIAPELRSCRSRYRRPLVHPVIEPYVLPASPYDAFASGQQNDVPLLLGSNAEKRVR